MTYYGNELYHHGIKGQKWGVRRYQNADGTLTAKGVKRYAKKGYAQDAYNSNKTKIGKAYDKYTGAHKIYGDAMYKLNSNKQNKARAEKYLSDKKKKLTEEDLVEYKYNKPGEGGWVGAGRAIKAKASERINKKRNTSSRSGAKNFAKGYGAKAAAKGLDKVGRDLYRKHAGNASPRAVRAVKACGILSKSLKTYSSTNYYTGFNEIFK